MALAYYTHPDMLDHRPGGRHPERPERLAAVTDALEDAADLDLEARAAPLIDRADLAAVHGEEFIASIIDAAPADGLVALDPDTRMSPGSLAAARRAAGAVTAAARAVAAGDIQRAS